MYERRRAPPVQSTWIYEIWSRERRYPSPKKPNRSCQAKSIGSQTLRRKFAARKPGEWTDGSIVDEDIDHGYRYDDLACLASTWVLLVDDGNDELAKRTDNQACSQENSAATISDHDCQVDEDGDDTDRDEDA